MRFGRRLLFMPTNLTKGIDVSDDPILNTRTEAYGKAAGTRNFQGPPALRKSEARMLKRSTQAAQSAYRRLAAC